MLVAVGCFMFGMLGIATGATSSYSQQAQRLDTPHAGFASVTCPSSATCVAAGTYYPTKNPEIPTTPVIATDSHGVWAERKVALPANAATPASSGLYGVACRGEHSCVAVGGYQDSSQNSEPLVASSGANGWIATELPLPRDAATHSQVAGLSGIACVNGECVAVGGYVNRAGYGQGLVATYAGGKWTAATVQPMNVTDRSSGGTTLRGVACPTLATCVAVGDFSRFSAHAQLIAVTKSYGAWNATPVNPPPNASSGPSAQLFAVACARPGACTAVGEYGAKPGNLVNDHALLAVETNGAWRTVDARLPHASGNESRTLDDLSGVACIRGGDCLAVGSYGLSNIGHGSTSHAIAIRETNGRWLTEIIRAPSGTESGLGAVGCAPTGRLCVAVGGYSVGKEGNAMAISTQLH